MWPYRLSDWPIASEVVSGFLGILPPLLLACIMVVEMRKRVVEKRERFVGSKACKTIGGVAKQV